MNIKKKSKGTPEQMLQAFICSELMDHSGIQPVYSSTDIDDSDDVNALWEALESSYKGPEITPQVIYDKAKELFPDNYIEVLDELFSPNNYEWYDSASANEWYNYMKETFDYEIPGLPFDDGSTEIQAASGLNDETGDFINADIGNSFQIGDAVMRIDDSEPGEIIDEDIEADEYLVSFDNGEEEWIHMTDLQLVDDDIIESATTITSADAAIDADYLEKLCEYVTADLDDAGYEAVARVEGEYIVIESMYDADSRYVQPIDSIEPNWDDLNDDAAELADAYMDEYPDSEGYTSFQAWYNKNYATDMTQMDYFLDRAEDLAMYYDEDELPLEKVPEIAKRWAEIAKEKSWSGAWNYPGLWHNYSDDLNDIREDLYDELERDGYPDCYFRQAAEEVLGHRLS